MFSLRRTMAAGFTLGESVTLEQVQELGEKLLRPTDSLFREHPEYRLKTARQEERCRNGRACRRGLTAFMAGRGISSA